VCEEQETGRARDEMRAGAPDRFSRLSGKVERDELRQRLGAPDHRAEAPGAEKIVAHAVASREPRLACEIRLGVEKIDGRCAGRILGIERAASQSLEKKPGPADGDARGRNPDEAF